MTYQAPLPNTGAILPVLGSGQAWEGSVYNGNLSGVDSAIGADRARLTTIEGKIAGNALIPAGTTAARDGLYGTPSTAAGRVALANAAPRWFNTDKGYEERYFAPTSDSAQAGYNTLFARVGGGWLPQGQGLVPVNWTAPTVVTGTAQANGNTLALNGVGSVACDGVFTQDFDAYLLLFDINQSAAQFLQAYLRTAGVDLNTAAAYARQVFTAIGASAAASATPSDTRALINYNAVQIWQGEAKIYTPAQAAKWTNIDASSFRSDGHGRITTVTASQAAHDGIKFQPASGTMTGSIKLFGFAGGHV